jgi:hypothetical protein
MGRVITSPELRGTLIIKEAAIVELLLKMIKEKINNHNDFFMI